MKIFALLMFIYLFSSTVAAATETPYAGQQHRDIKALSQSDIEGYLNGKGMGMAKAAELNHYPGPLHVLEVAGDLKLSKEQKKQTEDLFARMKANAETIGKQIVAKEQELDQQFAKGTVSNDTLSRILHEIGTLQSELRFVHLSAHLEQKQILSQHQVMLYDQLRGYDKGSHDAHHHHGH